MSITSEKGAAATLLAFLMRPMMVSRRVWGGLAVFALIVSVALHRTAVVEVPIPRSGPPDLGTAAKIAEGLLSNVNIAFLEKDPERLSKALDQIVSSDTRSDLEIELDAVQLFDATTEQRLGD